MEIWTVPTEAPLSLWVNEQPWVTLMCTPVARRHLALGHAYFAGLFADLSEVHVLAECLDDPNQIRMRLARTDLILPAHVLVTSGCGQGSVLPGFTADDPPPAPPDVAPEAIAELMRRLQSDSRVHQSVGGTHASALSDGAQLLALYEDIGRHNTIDKIMGHCLLTGLDARGKMLLTSGRVSSEMLHKALRMGASMIVSRTTPTDFVVQVARRIGLSLVGYVRARQLTVFSDGSCLSEGVGARAVVVP